MVDAAFQTEKKIAESFGPKPLSNVVYRRLANQMEAFKLLKPDWDSYQAPPTSPAAIQVGEEFLETLRRQERLNSTLQIHVFPMRDGGIQFEFDLENDACELEISPSGDLTLLTFNEDGDLLQTQNFQPTQTPDICQFLNDAFQH